MKKIYNIWKCSCNLSSAVRWTFTHLDGWLGLGRGWEAGQVV